jgi:hypothetical protein
MGVRHLDRIHKQRGEKRNREVKVTWNEKSSSICFFQTIFNFRGYLNRSVTQILPPMKSIRSEKCSLRVLSRLGNPEQRVQAMHYEVFFALSVGGDFQRPLHPMRER